MCIRDRVRHIRWLRGQGLPGISRGQWRPGAELGPSARLEGCLGIQALPHYRPLAVGQRLTCNDTRATALRK
eukprot:424916-Alexandrium_andersonii.AAC.1